MSILLAESDKSNLCQDDAFCIPTSIKNSSVGEFYEKTLKEIEAKTDGLVISRESRNLLRPLAVGREKGFFPADSLLYCLHSEVQETNPNHSVSDEFKQHLILIETISQSICSRYQPRMDIPNRQILKTDMNHLEEYAIANRIYRWVTHPMSQVRLIVPALSEEIRKDIISTFEVNDCDIGLYVVDCLDNFLTYLDIHANIPIFRYSDMRYPDKFFDVRRQFWTPFFKFKLNDEMEKLNEGYKTIINDVIAKSTRLYYEILKTGLKYEAQYALLAGFQGRFYMTFNTSVPDPSLMTKNSLNTEPLLQEVKRCVNL